MLSIARSSNFIVAAEGAFSFSTFMRCAQDDESEAEIAKAGSSQMTVPPTIDLPRSGSKRKQPFVYGMPNEACSSLGASKSYGR